MNEHEGKEKENGKGAMRLVRAARCSWAGISTAWKTEAAFRQETLLALVLVPLACWLGQTGLERAVLAGSVLLIILVELLNSAIEAVVDRIGPERHPLSGLAKDLGSAAVLLALIHAATIWALILLNK